MIEGRKKEEETKREAPAEMSQRRGNLNNGASVPIRLGNCVDWGIVPTL